MIKLPITGKPLKPCPFCGSKKLYLFQADVYSFHYYIIECGRCEAKIKRDTQTGVKRAWNRRELEGKAFVDGYKKGLKI